MGGKLYASCGSDNITAASHLMRVLHVISGLDPANGGPTFALEGLAKAQVREGLDVTVAATWQNQSGFPIAERMRKANVKVKLIGPAHGKLSHHPELASAIRVAVGETDVLHVHALWEQIQHQAAREAQKRGVPYVVTPHGMLSPWSLSQGSIVNRLGKRLYVMTRLRRNLDRAAAIHFTTSAERDLVAPMKLKPPAIVEPVGIDFAEFQKLPPAGGFRAKHAKLSGRTMVLFLSRLSVQKGLDRLIPAFARAVQDPRAADAILVLAGPDYDGYSRDVQAMVEKHALRDRVIFTGMLHGVDRIQAMRDADFFVLPSRHENFGIVVAEALAAGTPVLLSPEVNVSADVAAAGAGAVVSGDLGPLSAAIARWIAHPELRHGHAKNARAFAARYDWRNIAHHWLGHYQNLLVKNRAGGQA